MNGPDFFFLITFPSLITVCNKIDVGLRPCTCTYRRLYLQVYGSELDGLSFGMVERGVEGVGADGGVEDGGLLAWR